MLCYCWEVRCPSVVSFQGGTVSECCAVVGRYGVEMLCRCRKVQCIHVVSFQGGKVSKCCVRAWMYSGIVLLGGTVLLSKCCGVSGGHSV